MGKFLVKSAITVMRRYNEVIIKEEEIFPCFPLPPLTCNHIFLLLKLQIIGISRIHQVESVVKLAAERTLKEGISCQSIRTGGLLEQPNSS